MNESKNTSGETGETKSTSSFTDEARLGFAGGTIADLTIAQVQNLKFTDTIFHDGTEVQQVTFNDVADRMNGPYNEQKN